MYLGCQWGHMVVGLWERYPHVLTLFLFLESSYTFGCVHSTLMKVVTPHAGYPTGTPEVSLEQSKEIFLSYWRLFAFRHTYMWAVTNVVSFTGKGDCIVA